MHHFGAIVTEDIGPNIPQIITASLLHGMFNSKWPLAHRNNGETSPQRRHFTNDLETRHQNHFAHLSLIQLRYIQTRNLDKARNGGHTPNKRLKSSEKHAQNGSHGEWRCRRHQSRTRNVPYKSRSTTRLTVP